MVEMGLILKNTSASEFNLVMRYLEMRVEAKRVAQSEHEVIKADRKLRGHLRTHNIERVQAALEKQNRAGYAMARETHRLLINDFVCLKVLEKIAQETDDLIRKEIKAKRLGGKVGKRVENEEVQLVKGVRIKVNKLLQTARRIIDGLAHRCEGREDLAFFVKSKFFADMQIMNYFRMRYDAKGVRRDLETQKKKFKELKTALKQLKAGKGKQKDVLRLPKDLRKFRKATVTAIQDIFKLFTDSTILLDRVIGVFHDQVNEDDKLMRAHEIPIAMGQTDRETKTKTLNFIKRSLRDVNVARLQLELKRGRLAA